jgi:hypothetical protein
VDRKIPPSQLERSKPPYMPDYNDALAIYNDRLAGTILSE